MTRWPWGIVNTLSIVLFIVLQVGFWIAQLKHMEPLATVLLRAWEAIVAAWCVVLVMQKRGQILRLIRWLRRD
jgi:hypothetical protein